MAHITIFSNSYLYSVYQSHYIFLFKAEEDVIVLEFDQEISYNTNAEIRLV